MFSKRSRLCIFLCFATISVSYTAIVLLAYDTYVIRYVTPRNDRLPINNTNHSNINVLIEPDITMVTAQTVLVFIHSAPLHTQKRTLIRETWGNSSHYQQQNKFNFTVIFAIGNDYIGKPNKWSIIKDEMAQFNDVLLLNMRDEYNLLTLKGLYTMKWILHKLPQVQYVIKGDDDVLFNMFNWLNTVQTLDESTISCCVLCYAWRHSTLNRQNKKTAVSIQEYKYDNYPSFCSGMGYLMTTTAMDAILEASTHRQLFVRDDPYYTGMLAYIANVQLITVPRNSVVIYGDDNEIYGILQRPTLMIHDPSIPDWVLLWEQMVAYHSIGGKQRRFTITALTANERILPYIKPAFTFNYSSPLRDACLASGPGPGGSITIHV